MANTGGILNRANHTGTQPIESVEGLPEALNELNPQNNLEANAAPSASDDSTQGYSPLSIWIYDGVTYRCVDATPGAAVWIETGISADDLGSAAFASTSDFDPAGAAATAQAFARQRANHTGTQGIETVSGLVDALDERVVSGTVGDESVATSTGMQTVSDALDQRSIYPLNEETVNIPTDYPDLQSAVNALGGISGNPDVEQIILLIESGHALTKGLKVMYGDWSKFIIRSEDPIVYLDSEFMGVSDAGMEARGRDDNLILGYYATLPQLDCVIDMEGNFGCGYYGVWESHGFVTPYNGVINAGLNGIEFRGGSFTAHRGNFNGAGLSGVRCAYSCVGNFQSGTADDCGYNGGGILAASIDVSRSATLHARLCSADRAFYQAVNVRRNCTFNGEEGSYDDSLGLGVRIHQAANASIYGSSMQRAQGINDLGYGLWVSSGASVAAAGSVIKDNNGFDIRLGDTATIGGSAAIVDLSTVETTNGMLDPLDINVRVNYISRFGIAFDHTKDFPDFGVFSNIGIASGKSMPGNGLIDSSRSGTSNTAHYRLFNGNGQVGNISTSGTSTTYNTTSDETLKEFDGPLSGIKAIEIIKADPVRRFKWKEDKGGGEDVGWGAQTSYEISPDLATPGGWFDTETGEEVGEGAENSEYQPWGIDQSKRTPYLWAAVSHLVDEVQRLRDIIDEK